MSRPVLVYLRGLWRRLAAWWRHDDEGLEAVRQQLPEQTAQLEQMNQAAWHELDRRVRELPECVVARIDADKTLSLAIARAMGVPVEQGVRRDG